MLFPRRFWPGLADGTVTVAFRRWRRPSVETGGTLQTPIGVWSIDEVATIEVEEVTDEDARAAGYRDRAQVLADLHLTVTCTASASTTWAPIRESSSEAAPGSRSPR